jgi:hypothetical protein
VTTNEPPVPPAHTAENSLSEEQFGKLATAHLLIERCVMLAGIGGAAVILPAPDGAPRAAMASAGSLTEILQRELEDGKGPGWDCFHTGRPVPMTGLGTQPARWGRFTAVALAAGYAAVQAVPMRQRDRVLGVVELFATDAFPLDRPSRWTVQALVDMATLSLAHQRALERQLDLTGQLQHALNSRVLIEQAKGVLAARAGVSMQDAFNALRGHARSHSLLLTEVARAVIDATAEESPAGTPVPRPPRESDLRVRAALRALLDRESARRVRREG